LHFMSLAPQTSALRGLEAGNSREIFTVHRVGFLALHVVSPADLLPSWA